MPATQTCIATVSAFSREASAIVNGQLLQPRLLEILPLVAAAVSAEQRVPALRLAGPPLHMKATCSAAAVVLDFPV